MAGYDESRFKGGLPQYLIRHTTFRQLQIFEAIVRLGSFTRAAEELFLTQPTVSTQFKKLTAAMELSLIEQSGRRLRVTEAGEELYQTVRAIFDSMADLDTRLAELKGLRRGRLRVGVITTAKHFAPEILGDFCRRYPEVDVSLHVANREQIYERIINNEDDLFILGQPPEELRVEAHPFAPNPLVVMAGREHPLCRESDIPVERIAREPFIMREPGSGTRDAAMKLFAQHGLTPNIRMELSSNEAIKHTVVGGLGISVLSLHTLSLEGAEGPVDILDVQGFPIQRQWYLVHQEGKAFTSVAQAFLEFAQSSEAQLRERMANLYQRFSERHQTRRLQGSPQTDTDNQVSTS
ncbi:MAG: LysR substrate-binding domain-containing protein [Pseudomonadota bacterium]